MQAVTNCDSQKISRKNLIDESITINKAIRLLEINKGKELFIDEAYDVKASEKSFTQENLVKLNYYLSLYR